MWDVDDRVTCHIDPAVEDRACSPTFMVNAPTRQGSAKKQASQWWDFDDHVGCKCPVECMHLAASPISYVGTWMMNQRYKLYVSLLCMSLPLTTHHV